MRSSLTEVSLSLPALWDVELRVAGGGPAEELGIANHVVGEVGKGFQLLGEMLHAHQLQ